MRLSTTCWAARTTHTCAMELATNSEELGPRGPGRSTKEGSDKCARSPEDSCHSAPQWCRWLRCSSRSGLCEADSSHISGDPPFGLWAHLSAPSPDQPAKELHQGWRTVRCVACLEDNCLSGLPSRAWLPSSGGSSQTMAALKFALGWADSGPAWLPGRQPEAPRHMVNGGPPGPRSRPAEPRASRARARPRRLARRRPAAPPGGRR